MASERTRLVRASDRGHETTQTPGMTRDEAVRTASLWAGSATTAGHTFSGWHHHPGVILVLVKSGTVTTHDENCQTKTYSAGQAFVESGTAPFMVSNESDTETAVDVATQVAPAGSPFRIEDDPPPCAG